MSAWLWIALGWATFGGTHMLLSSRGMRPKLVRRLGALGFTGLYSAIAFACFVPLVSYYLDHRHAGALLWSLPHLHTLSLLLSALFFALTIAALIQPSPLGITPGAKIRPYGLTRITRHPAFLSLGLWGLSHTLVNGFASDVAFFGGFFVFALVGCAHQDARKRSENRPELAELFAQTSFWPFSAIATGRTRLVLAELPWLGLAIGLGASAGAYALHGVLR